MKHASVEARIARKHHQPVNIIQESLTGRPRLKPFEAAVSDPRLCGATTKVSADAKMGKSAHDHSLVALAGRSRITLRTKPRADKDETVGVLER
jgi:hypothetical protein